MITLYILDLEDEVDTKLYQHLTALEINIISMNTQSNTSYEETGSIALIDPHYRPKTFAKERKIGNTTFIVSSRFNDAEPSDIVSKIARLIQRDNENIPLVCS